MNAPWIKEEDVPAFVAWLDLFAEGQQALGYKAGLDAAVNVVKSEASQYAEPVWAVEIINDILELHVPEVQWRDLTDEEIEAIAKENDTWSLFKSLRIFDFANAVIAKFKAKQVGTLQSN